MKLFCDKYSETRKPYSKSIHFVHRVSFKIRNIPNALLQNFCLKTYYFYFRKHFTSFPFRNIKNCMIKKSLFLCNYVAILQNITLK